MNTPLPPPRRLVAALVAALFSSAAVAADPPFVADGDELTVDPGDYATFGDSESVLSVLKNGKATADDVHFTTGGKHAHAVKVSGTGSQLDLTASSLTTSGVGAHGLSIADTGTTSAVLQGVTILTKEASAAGMHVTGAQTGATFTAGGIVTTGYAANAIEALRGAGAYVKDTRLETSGKSAAGLLASGDGAGISAENVDLKTTGEQSHGVFTEAEAFVVLNASKVRTEGDGANAVNVNTKAGQANLFDTTLVTTGAAASAVSIFDGLVVHLTKSHIVTEGSGSIGVENRGAFVELSDVDISTKGRSAYGIVAKGGTYTDHQAGFSGTNLIITTEGRFAYGAAATDGGRVSLAKSGIETSGPNAHGLYDSAGDISVTDTRIETSGSVAYGALVSDGGKLSMKGGGIISAQAAALGLHDPGTIRIGGNAVLSGNGAFAEVDPTSTRPFTIVLDDTAQAIGDIRLSDEPGPQPPDATKTLVSVRHGATWSGATTIVRNVDLQNGGTWRITGDSTIGAMRNDKGVVAFAPSDASKTATLTITGDYIGSNGLIRMRTYLGDDASPTDGLHVMGNTSGDGRIEVASLGGHGDYNRDGIRLVQVDGESKAQFVLAGRAVAGANEYFLHQGSVSQPDDGDWYLRSMVPEPTLDPEQGDESADDPIDEPVAPPDVPRAPVLRPETGTYRANQTAVLEMFQGGPGAGEDDEPDASQGAGWARFERHHTTFDFRDQITTTTSANELTLGSDLWRGGTAIETHVGVMAAVGQADTAGRSLLTRYAAKGRVRGAAAGLYAGMRSDAGTYLRGWTRFARFNERVEGNGLPTERYGSHTVSGSIEGGHRWRSAITRHTDAYLEPQAQIIATRLRGGTHTEANGTRVAPIHASGATARLGLRAAARWQTPGGHIASPYITTNWLRRLGRLDATQFDNTAIDGGVPRNAYALKLGVTFLRQSGWRLWGDVETRFGARNYRRVAGTIGIRRNW
ncbi:autotransporter family porin [Luteibacter sp. UNCMF331Sha3.1]|nr:autotransporter family porin [Luteibacter sp. UNCMF331Sha3.1]